MRDLELVRETVQFYTEDKSRRCTRTKKAKNGGKDFEECVYKAGNRHCSVGRLLDEEKLKENNLSWEELNKEGGIDSVSSLLNVKGLNVDDILKDKYVGASHECLEYLQDFHDYDLNFPDYKQRGENLISKYEK